MTYPDRTVYPVASPNLTDFYNLVDVYLDAVFHPRLVPAVFQQEGWIHEVLDAAPAAAASAPGGSAAAPAGAGGVVGAVALKYVGCVRGLHRRGWV
jgi:hypothetical protein